MAKSSASDSARHHYAVRRYYSILLTDMYTCNYDYIGSRATGNGAGTYMIAGPNWKGETPKGFQKVFRCETHFPLAVSRSALGYRTFYKGDWTRKASIDKSRKIKG
jgi:hypothetical protein